MRIQMLALSTLFVSSFAFADLGPPGTDECSGRTAGAACTISGAAGACTTARCTVLRPPPDAGLDGGDAGDASRVPTEIDCLRCVATVPQGGADSGPVTTDAGTNTSTGADDVTGAGCSTTQGRNAFGSIVLALGFAALVSRKKNKR